MGCKVFLTYKRKRLSGNNGHGNGSKIPISVPKDTTLCDELIDNRSTEDETGNSSHVCRERGSHCGCVDKQDSTESPSSTQKSDSFEAKKNTEESTTRLGSPSSDRGDEIPGPHSRDYVGEEPSLKRKNCFESDDIPSMSKTLIEGIPESLVKDKAPLITFVRRCKRKNDDKIGNKQSNISPSEKGCDATGLKTIEARATNDTISQIKNTIPEVDSACQGAKILMIVEREGPIDVQNVSTNVLHEGEKVVDFPEDTSCQEVSLNNATRDSSSRGIDVTSVQNSGKIRTSERDESRTPRLVLDLSLIPTDSSGTLESNSEMPYVHCVTETVLGSMDSTSRSHAFVSHQNFPPETSNIAKVRLEESITNHHSCLGREASALVEEPGSDHKNKCLQLFPEERTEDSFHSAFNHAEDVRKRFRFETENNPQKRKSPPFLGLSLPTKPKTTRFASTNGNEYRTFPFPIPVCETQQQRPSSGRFSSFLRHNKSTMLKSFSLAWTEEELDSLWVGVRRYGRENWNTMIRDPRLRFSPWRSVSELADQWEEEQRKLFQRPSAEETNLSLGDVYNNNNNNNKSRSRGRNGPRARKARFKSGPNHTQQLHGKPTIGGGAPYQGVNFGPSTASQGNLPHWLREAVFSPAILGASPIACSQMMRVHVAWPRGGGGTRGNPDRSFGADRVIVIESDPSSEETISDERCA